MHDFYAADTDNSITIDEPEFKAHYLLHESEDAKKCEKLEKLL